MTPRDENGLIDLEWLLEAFKLRFRMEELGLIPDDLKVKSDLKPSEEDGC